MMKCDIIHFGNTTEESLHLCKMPFLGIDHCSIVIGSNHAVGEKFAYRSKYFSFGNKRIYLCI